MTRRRLPTVYVVRGFVTSAPIDIRMVMPAGKAATHPAGNLIPSRSNAERPEEVLRNG